MPRRSTNSSSPSVPRQNAQSPAENQNSNGDQIQPRRRSTLSRNQRLADDLRRTETEIEYYRQLVGAMEVNELNMAFRVQQLEEQRDFCFRSMLEHKQNAEELQQQVMKFEREKEHASQFVQTLMHEKNICPRCNNNFDNQERLPKVLGCGHKICSKCIGECATRDVTSQNGEHLVTCPVENSKTTVMNDGFSSLLMNIPSTSSN